MDFNNGFYRFNPNGNQQSGNQPPRQQNPITIDVNFDKIKKIIPMIADLRDAYTQISQMTKEEIEAQAKANAEKK